MAEVEVAPIVAGPFHTRDEYLAMIEEFRPGMLEELVANDFKGGQAGWNDPHALVKEAYYHVGKLQEALRALDAERVEEFCHDLGNLGLIIRYAFQHPKAPLKKVSLNHNGEPPPTHLEWSKKHDATY